MRYQRKMKKYSGFHLLSVFPPIAGRGSAVESAECTDEVAYIKEAAEHGNFRY